MELPSAVLLVVLVSFGFLVMVPLYDVMSY